MQLFKYLAIVVIVAYIMQGTHASSTFLIPGETYPDTVEILVGASVNISCTMNKSVFLERTAADLYFIDSTTQKRVPAEDIEIINATTIVYMLRNAPLQQTSYLCKCDSDAIMDTKVYVGTRPAEVLDFDCRSYDLEYMTCNFTKPPNPLLTQYNLTLYTSSKYYMYTPLCYYPENLLVVCNITSRFDDNYHFKLHARNAVGEREQQFHINYIDVTVPAAPGEKFRIDYLSSEALDIAWRMPKFNHYGTKGLKWQVLLQPEKFDVMDLSSEIEIKRTGNEMHLQLRNLAYAFYSYVLTVRVKVRTAADVPLMWSEPFIYKFRTKARQPDRPPRTNLGSFYVNSSEVQVRLFWEQLEPHEYNGDNFTYVISGMESNGKKVQMSPKYIESNSAIFAWRKSESYIYEIRSRNHMGVSKEASYIKIPMMTYRNPREYTPRAIHNVYHANNRTYTLTWEPPINDNDLMDYTVFWCYSKRALQNECKASIHFKSVGNDAQRFTTEPQSAQQEHTLNLAISANYDDYNTGMHWTPCTIDVNSDLIKIMPEVEAINSTIIKVQWSPESVCPSILEGYNLTYCEVAEIAAVDENANCVNELESIAVDKNLKKLEIAHLKPYTKYRIGIYMYSSRKEGKISEPIVVRTKEAAPTPPRQLQIKNITNVSVTLSWLPPSHAHGKIRSYIITLNNEQFEMLPNEEDPNAEMIITLPNLTSFSTYKAYVMAKTVEISQNSNDIHFTTHIGYPSLPGNVSPIRDTNNTAIIEWSKPDEPAGRIDYYEVAVSSLKNEEIVKRHISRVIGNTTCAVRIPVCVDHEYKTTIQVRAVNAALLTQEVSDDDEGSNKYIDHTDDYYYNEYDELMCTVSTTESAEESLSSYQDATKYRLYKSQWQSGPTYACSKNRHGAMTFMALGSLIAIIGLMSLFYWLRNIYNRMSNIKCTLPPGLDTYFAKDSGFAGGELALTADKGEDALHVDMRKDEFMFHNEKRHLLAKVCNDSGYLGGACEAVENVHRRDGGGGGGERVSDISHISHVKPIFVASNIGTNAAYIRSQSESSADTYVQSIDSVMELTDTTDIENQTATTTILNKSNQLQRIAEDDNPYITACNMKLLNNSGYIKPTTMLSWHAAQQQQQNDKNNIELQQSEDDYGNADDDDAEEQEEVESEQEEAQKDYYELQKQQQQQHTKVASQRSCMGGGGINVSGYVEPAELHKIIATPAVAATTTIKPTLSQPAADNTTNATTVNGYTTLGQLQQISANVKGNQLAQHILTPTAAAAATSTGLMTDNRNISGYVTQRELTEFGQQQQQQYN